MSAEDASKSIGPTGCLLRYISCLLNSSGISDASDSGQRPTSLSCPQITYRKTQFYKFIQSPLLSCPGHVSLGLSFSLITSQSLILFGGRCVAGGCGDVPLDGIDRANGAQDRLRCSISKSLNKSLPFSASPFSPEKLNSRCDKGSHK